MTLIEELRERADQIDRAVSRDKEDRESGAWSEIELMRQAADRIYFLESGAEEDMVLFRAILERRRLTGEITAAKKALAEADAIVFPNTK